MLDYRYLAPYDAVAGYRVRVDAAIVMTQQSSLAMLHGAPTAMVSGVGKGSASRAVGMGSNKLPPSSAGSSASSAFSTSGVVGGVGNYLLKVVHYQYPPSPLTSTHTGGVPISLHVTSGGSGHLPVTPGGAHFTRLHDWAAPQTAQRFRDGFVNYAEAIFHPSTVIVVELRGFVPRAKGGGFDALPSPLGWGVLPVFDAAGE